MNQSILLIVFAAAVLLFGFTVLGVVLRRRESRMIKAAISENH